MYLNSILNRTIDEQINFLSYQTKILRENIYGNSNNFTNSDVWSPKKRKEIHENYWGSLVLKELDKVLINNQISFEDCWKNLNFIEFLNGSGDGKRLKRKFSTHNKLPKVFRNILFKHYNEIYQMPAMDYLYDKKLKKINLFESHKIKVKFFTDLLAPFYKKNCILLDLGSGWGRYSTLFASQFPNLKIFSGEISEAGRETTNKLSSKYDFNIKTFNFNYLDWNECIKIINDTSASNIIIFTNHSIEQVTYLNMDFFTDLCKIPKNIQFINIEPVGWQFRKSKFSTPPPKNIGENGGYNKNLSLILLRLESEKILKINKVIQNYFALGNVYNSGTLLSYETINN